MKIISTNPGNNYEVIGEVESATERDVVEAVASARKAYPLWAALSIEERCAKLRTFLEVCREHSEEIAQIMSQEMGKPITSSRESITATFGEFEDYMQQAPSALAPSVVFESETEKHIQVYEPLGVIAAIAPWNSV
jgi:succinate-semialdehyde dehydrogenase/glutarate-semialdehyde dehydrogenase